MLNKFFILLRKELRELITLQLILPLIITAGMFLFLGNVIGKQQEKAQGSQLVTVLDQDHTPTSAAVTDVLKKAHFQVNAAGDVSVDAALANARNSSTKGVLVIPPGFEKGIQGGQQQNIEVYSILRNFSFIGAQSFATVKSALSYLNDSFSTQLISQQLTTNPDIIKNPLKSNDHVVIGEKQAITDPTLIISFVSAQTTFIPIILFFVIIFSAQMIATAIASEKENKTLETLLSMPIGRKQIVTAKMLAAALVAGLSSLIYLFGIRHYTNGITGSTSEAATSVASKAAQQLGLVLTPLDYVYLGISLFVGILVALAISLILGAFAEDVKAIQGLITPLMVLVLIPYLLTLLVDTSTLPKLGQYAIWAIPFSHPFMAATNLFLKNDAAVIYGILYQIVWFVIFVMIASKIFTTDRIVTMKINFSKKKKSSV